MAAKCDDVPGKTLGVDENQLTGLFQSPWIIS